MTTALKAVTDVDRITIVLPECETYLLALSVSSKNQGSGIKDLRLIERLSQYLESVMPKRPEQPKFAPPKDGKGYTPEETKANTQVMLDYNNEMKKTLEQSFDLELSSQDKALLRQKMLQCSVFPGDRELRKVILSAADKIGA